MKKVGLFLAALFCMVIASQTASAQVAIDSFNDGNFTSSPVWTGDTGFWSVVADSDVAAGATGSNTLRLNSDNTSPNQLRTQIAIWDAQQSWGFFLGRRGQAYTAANQTIIWLYANEADLLSATVDGYRLLIGDDTGNDEIFLQRVVNGVATTILTSSGAITNGLTDIGFLVRVTRTSAGLFTLYTSTLPTANGTGAIATALPNDANVTVNQGSVTDTTITPAANGFFGVVSVHSTGAAARAALELDQIDLVAAPTAVELMSFGALTDESGKVFLQWKTGYEVDNLGFNIYREVAGRRTRVNPSLVAGSALMAGRTTLTAGYSYAWLDPLGSKVYAQYWLEDVDLDGKTTLHGPISPMPGGKLPPQANALLLSRLNSNAAIVRQQIITPSSKASVGSGKAGVKPVNSLQAQWDIAGQAGAKLSVRADGWYRVTQPELVAAGFDVSRDPRFLQLYVEGSEAPIIVNGGASGHLESGDSIEFYAKGIDTPSTDLHAYYLINGKTPGRRINVVNSNGIVSNNQNFSATIERKERSTYFAALKNGDADNWFGSIITTDAVTQPMSVQHLDSSSATGAVLEVALQGVTADTSHSVKVMLNGSDVGTINFSGQAHQVSSLTIANGALLEGNNVVTLQAQGGEMDINLLDYVRLTYAHTFAADNNQLLFTAAGQTLVTVGGFNAAGIRALDITDPNKVKEIIGTISATGGSYSILVGAQDGGPRVLYAFADSAVAHPAKIAANLPSSWNRTNQVADLVIISHRNFIASLDSLKALRRSQGYTVSVVDVEDIYDEFSYGMRAPQAIRDFLARARSAWKRGPRFALLVGDASSDPRNYLGLGDSDFVPTKLIDTAQMETASDDWFADFNDDGLPELAVGRLPARTAGESSTMARKIVEYAQLARPEEVLLVTDRNDGFDFEAASNDVKALIPSSVVVREVFRSALDDATAHSRIVQYMDRGPKIVNYIGHGSFGLWRGNSLTSADAPNLGNGPNYSFVMTMTCLNGQFQDPYTDGLAESLIKAEQGGAVAVWASSALTEPAAQALMNKEVMRQIFAGAGTNDPAVTLGEAVMRAKALSNNGDVRRTWILLGDPLTRLR